jgi:predicted  nucleic acid-binding Zn-ribbon protein
MLETRENQSIDTMTIENQGLGTSDKALFDSQPFETAKKKNKLLRVALLNSYLKGQSHLIEVDSNTILTGRNSAGKTTLMGAIVPFFGTKLSSISKKSEVHKSFVEFYLPYANSYIVYEYIRDGQKKCVLIRNSSGVQVFNFIDSEYKEKWFVSLDLQGKRSFHQFDVVKANIESDGLYISNNVRQLSYEAIISNCPPHRVKASIRSTDSLRSISALRHDFSLATGKGSFYGFASIASNILQTKLEFNEICEFLVEAMKAENKVRDNEIVIDSKGVDTAKWVRQRDTWGKIEVLRPQFDRLSLAVKMNASNQHDLSADISIISGLLTELNNKITSNKDLLNQYQNSISLLKNDIDAVTAQWKRDQGDLDAQISRLTLDINKLEARKLEFENGITGKHKPMNELKELSSQIQAFNTQKDHQVSLLNDYEDKEREAAAIIKQIEAVLQKELLAIENSKNQKLANIENEITRAENVYERAHSQLMKTQYTHIESIRNHAKIQTDKIRDKLQELRIAEARLEQSVTSIDISPSYKQEIEKTAGEIRAKQQQLNQDIGNESVAKNDVRDAQAENSILQNELAEISRSIERFQLDYKNLQDLLKGDTLFSFLVQSEEEQSLVATVDQVRRTIDPALLNRTDLEPSWLDTDGSASHNQTNDSLYGLVIDTAKIDNAKSQSRREITQQMLNIDAQISSKYEQKKVTESGLLASQKRIKLTRDGNYQATVNITKTKESIVSLEQSSKQLELRAKADIEDRKTKLAQQVAALSSEIAGKQKELTNIERGAQENIDNIKQQDNIKLKQLETTQTQRKEQLDQDKKTATVEAQKKSSLAGQRRDSAIDTNGYDDSAILDVRATIKNITDQIKRAEAAQLRVTLYEDFLTEEYIQASAYTHQRSELESIIITKTQAFNETIEEKTREAGSLSEQASSIEQDLTAANADLERLETNLKAANNTFVSTLVPNQPPAVEFASKTLLELHDTALSVLDKSKETIEKTRINIKEGIAILTAVKSPFINNESMFETLLANDSTVGRPDDYNWFIQARVFIEYLNNEHETRKEVIINHYLVEAHKIRDFKYKLDQAHHSLTTFSNRINRSCREVCDKLGALAIENLKITLTSSIRDNEWYSVLNTFTEAFEEWVNKDIHDRYRMPDEDLLMKLDQVQSYIGQNKMNIKLSEQFFVSLTVKQRGKEEQHTDRAKSFPDIGSNGTMRIAQLIIYIALLSVISTTDTSELKFFIDEVGVLDPTNTQELLSLLQKLGISAMCAAPENPHDAVIPLFSNNIGCAYDINTYRYELSQTDDMYSLTQDHQLEQYGVFEE